MEIKKQVLVLSEQIKNNDFNNALDTLNKMIDFKSKKPNCCSNCSGYGFKNSIGCKRDSSQSWFTLLNEFKPFLVDHINNKIDKKYKLPFNVFKMGNGKLPFLNYSTIPIVNCVGADLCKTYCYSLNSLRFPKASLSWLQNQILENDYFYLIEIELEQILNSKFKNKIKKGLKVDFRLYNDGDFSNLNNMVLWFNLLKKYPVIKCYGYSKSLNLIKELSLMNYEFPKNYKFNVSLGGKFDFLKNDKTILNNPCYRGNFVSFNFEGKRVKAKEITKNQRKTIRTNFKNKVFICPAVCGSCTSIGHACGSDKFKNIDIVIPIH